MTYKKCKWYLMHHNRSDLLGSLFFLPHRPPEDQALISIFDVWHNYKRTQKRGSFISIGFLLPSLPGPFTHSHQNATKMPAGKWKHYSPDRHSCQLCGKTLAVVALLHILFIICRTWKCHRLSCDLSVHQTSMQIKNREVGVRFILYPFWNLSFSRIVIYTMQKAQARYRWAKSEASGKGGTALYFRWSGSKRCHLVCHQ